MIPALIVEDNSQDQDYLKLLMKSFPEVDILDTASTVEQACEKMIQYKPSLLFLDVELGCQAGFDVLYAIKEYNLHPSVIFTTGYDKCMRWKRYVIRL